MQLKLTIPIPPHRKTARADAHDYDVRVSKGVVWVIGEESTIAGIIVLLPMTDHSLLDNIAVAPAKRGQPKRVVSYAVPWFESISLQRRVRLSPGAAFEGREPRLSARLCGDPVGRDAQGFPFRANRRQYLCRAIFQYRSAADGVGENATPVPIKSGRSPELDRAVDRCARTGLNQSPARSADRARQAAGVSARGASLASDRAAAAHRGSPG